MLLILLLTFTLTPTFATLPTNAMEQVRGKQAIVIDVREDAELRDGKIAAAMHFPHFKIGHGGMGSLS